MRISKSTKPVVCITMGYPSGIGPEITLKALASYGVRRVAGFLIIGDLYIFNKACALTGKKLKCRVINRDADIDLSPGEALLYDMDNVPRGNFHFGAVSKQCGSASIEYINKAVSIIKGKKADILVTAPIHKHAAGLSGFEYPGHTEYLTRLSGVKDYAMMLVGGGLKVIPATTHVPLKDVHKRLDKKKIIDIIALADISLKRFFGITRPRIAVCGLNPHAGDSGFLGREEIDIIAPAVRAAGRKGIDASGPHAADAVFYDAYKGLYDLVICMYHDQGLVALKMIGRDESVNITLGLPFIRTSPGHGTALDIAGKGIASAESMKEAIKTAVEMYKKRC